MHLALSANFGISGALRKNFAKALSFIVIPTNPPDVFMERLMCSKVLSAPTEQNGTSFLLTTQFPWINS